MSSSLWIRDALYRRLLTSGQFNAKFRQVARFPTK
nr:MAG TPA: hypothetical protein [Caudoviricetes sp.]